MKRWTRLALFAAVAAAAACAPRERTIVVLSTNDMHANIQHFPRLAAAVEACRDTVPDALLVDAGDRWTGNAYVDKTAVPGKPVIELMNRLRYDVATLGNHEFDHGQAFLGRMIDSMDFEVVCANVLSDTCTFPQLPAATIVERGGVKIGFVGAVTNYEGPGHPAGNAASFAGLEFPDPLAEAIRRAEELRGRVDVLVLVSHMGDDRDEELLGRTRLFDLVIGGHTHVLRDTVVNGTLLTQTGKDLRYVGVTEIRLRGGKVQSADFRLVPLDGYGPDAGFAAEVERYYASPELNRPVGAFAATMDKQGLANWMAAAVADEADAALLIAQEHLVRQLANVEEFDVAVEASKPAESAVVLGCGLEVYIVLAGHVDFAAERARLVKERDGVAKDAAKFEKKLSNPGFLAKAASEIVEKDRAKLADLTDKLARLDAQIAELG